jgi:hypothetical protein
MAPRTTHTLNVAFMLADESDHWLNRLTARVSKHPFCHCEIHFDTTNQCFSIQAGELAALRTKSLGNPNYRIVSLGVSAAEYQGCLSFCEAATSWGLGLDDHAMFRSYYGCGCCEPSSRMAGSTFCSKIVTEALQYGGVPEVERLNPATTTPSRLYDAVHRSGRVVCASVPYKRGVLAHAAATARPAEPGLGCMR